MKQAYIDGEYVALSDTKLAELAELQNADAPVCEPTQEDRVQQLAAGLSTAKTIAEIRLAAKQILAETGGGEPDGE